MIGRRSSNYLSIYSYLSIYIHNNIYLIFKDFLIINYIIRKYFLNIFILKSIKITITLNIIYKQLDIKI